jgi:hypothetical protein
MRMREIAIQYVERFALEDDQRFEFLDRAEQYFDIWCPPDNPHCPYPWHGCNLRWCGIMDRQAVERGDRDLAWDYKTTSRMEGTYWERYKFSFQIPGYVWACSHLLGTLAYGAKLDVLYTLKASHEFFRRTFKYEPIQIAEWLHNTRTCIEDIQGWWQRAPDDPEAWPKNWQDCTRYRECMFSDIHFRLPDPETRLRIMSEDYVEERWDPAKRID